MKSTQRRDRGRGGSDGGGKGIGKTILPGVGDVTHQQIATVLHIMGSLIPFVLKGAFRSEGETQEVRELDGGAACAAAASIIKASSRLDAILDDDSRWDIKHVLDNQDKIRAAVDDQKELLRTQLDHINRPSTKLNPAVGFQPEEGRWVAVHQSPDKNMIPIHGVGATPEEALEDFDRAFMGIIGQLAKAAEKAESKVRRKSSKPKDEPNE